MAVHIIPRRLSLRYACAPLVVAAALVGTRLGWPILHNTPFLLFWIAFAWAAYDRRRGPAQLTIALGAVSAYLFLPLGSDRSRAVAVLVVTAIIGTELMMGRLRARLAVTESEYRFRAFFETDLVANFIATPDGRLVKWNARFAALMGSVDQAPVLPVLLGADTYEALRERIAKGTSLWRPSLTIERAGERLRVDARFVGIQDADGRLQSIAGCLVDLTERYRVNAHIQRWQKLDALERLVVGLVYHFKNLLAIIVGRADVLAAELGAESPLREDVRELQRAGARANTLTTQLVAFSGQQALQAATVDVNALVRTVAAAPPCGAQPITIDTGASESPCVVRIDPAQLETVLRQMVTNACDAQPGGGHVTLETAVIDLTTPPLNREELNPGVYVQIAVSDGGVGMPPDVRNRLFEPFFTTKASGAGTGLSLATAYGLVRQSGGFIEAYSRPGQGTTFEIYLPSADLRSVPDCTISGPLVFDFGTILVVAPDAARRGRVAQLLRRYDYNVVETETIDAALSALRSGYAVHAVLLDGLGAGKAAVLTAARPGLKIALAPDGPVLPLATVRRVRDVLASPV